MYTLHGTYTTETNFYNGHDVFDLIQQYGSPLYIYNEEILRTRCKEIKNLVTYPHFTPHFSIKANTNIHLLQIVREEGLHADVMSPGEIYLALESGFTPDELFFIPNNVVPEDMQYAIDRGITVSVDSLDQLALYGELNRGGKVAIRFNPGVGAGHCEKVVTGGKKTKFGINAEYIPEVKRLLETYELTLIGINQHIGSLFMDAQPYIDSVASILDIARQFDDLKFIDLGGGFGIPYHKQEGEKRLDLKALGEALDPILYDFAKEYGKPVQFQIEPGRYIPCECCVLLGHVTAMKTNATHDYMGCDIGFNILQRPIMYGSHHDIEIYSRTEKAAPLAPYTVVGNICESGDILAKDRMLPQTTARGDLLAVMDTGAYGYCMASCYNQRFRPAEILIQKDGSIKQIRKRDTFEDLVRNML